MSSASKSALLLSPCLRWAWSGAKPYESEFVDTTKRDKGTNFHNCMDGHYRGVSELELAAWAKWSDVYEWVKLAIKWSLEHLEPRCQEILPEVYVAFNFDTGEVHTDVSVRNRQYPNKPGFLPGTCDLACLLTDGSLLVADWKTGGGTGADKQLLTLALGLREVFRLPGGLYRKVRLAVLYAGDDGVRPVEWEVTDAELEAHRFAMALQLADVGVRKDAVPGIHCTQLYCPHLAYCPGIAQVVDASSEASEGLLAPASLVRRYNIQDAPTSEEHAGYIMERVTAAKRQMEFYQERIRKWASDGNRVVSGDFEYSKGKDGFRWRPKK